MSTRTKELKKKFIHKAIVARREEGKRSVLSYRPEVRICVERCRLFTEGYREAEGQPECLRQAKALVNLLDKRSIFIFEDERIVGNFGSDPAAIPCYPEMEQAELLYGITQGDIKGMVDDRERDELVEICRYWEGKSVGDRVKSLIPEDTLAYHDVNGVCETLHHRRGHQLLPNYETVLQVGLNGLIEQVAAKLNQLKSSCPQGMETERYIESKYFLEAMLISLEAVVRYAGRYAALARQMAENEERDWRKKELDEIAIACEWVPGNPPRSLL